MSKRPLTEQDVGERLLKASKQGSLSSYLSGVDKAKAKARAQASSNASAPPGTWSAADDKWLWDHRNDSVGDLGRALNRGDGAVRSRLKHLYDPAHTAYARLFSGGANQAAAAAPPPAGTLNEEQRRAVALASDGESFFLTGGAGTGKSFTLHHVVAALQRRHGARSVFVTGSTGIAACHVNGTTLHAFSGVGLGKEDVDTLVARITQNRAASARWFECRALVIDEVSMLDGELFDKLELIARRMTHVDAPFGGLQLILCGDFFQLPPVSRRGERPALFLFQSRCWPLVVRTSIVLQTVLRQRDAAFIDLLNQMRIGQLSAFSVATLQHLACKGREAAAADAAAASVGAAVDSAFAADALSAAHVASSASAGDGQVAQTNAAAAAPADAAAGPESRIASFAFSGAAPPSTSARPPPPPPKPVRGLKLFPQNEPADHENDKRLAEIDMQPHKYDASEYGGKLDGCLAAASLTLKLGAQVILLKNLDAASKLVNGSRGTVTGFLPAHADPDVKSAPPPPTAPLTGSAAGAAALAVARGGLAISGGGAVSGGGAGGEAGGSREDAGAGQPTGIYPVVTFSNGVERLITPETWKVEQGDRVIAQRVQVPLKLAWALSIHKSQGMTLHQVELELAQCFEPGHAYVALSRVVSLDATRLLSFDPSRVRASPAVLAFYRQLEQTERTRTGAPAASSAVASAAPALTEEQKARIAANKAAALERAAAKKAELARQQAQAS